MTYEVDGVQYIAVPAGRSNQTEAALTPSIGMPIGSGNSVFVFKLRSALR
jgi:alcohol dehydrogenase (cytochrome c)